MDFFKQGVIDKDKYNALQAFGDDDFIKEIIDVFIFHVTAYLYELDKAIEREDFEEIGKLLHKIQGSASTVGAKKMTMELMKLSAFAKSRDQRNLKEFKSKLHNSFSTTKVALLELKLAINLPKS